MDAADRRETAAAKRRLREGTISTALGFNGKQGLDALEGMLR